MQTFVDRGHTGYARNLEVRISARTSNCFWL